MKRDQLFPSKYLKAPDLRGRDVAVTIDNVEQTKIQGDAVNIVHFQGKDKGLIMNVTIYNQIAKVVGTDDTDEWNGKRITIFPTTTEFKGEEVDCIRVRTSNGKPAQRAEPEPSEPPDDYDF